MKTIKKYFQVILCFLAFAAASFLFAFAPSFGSYAALVTTEQNYNMSIKALKMPRATYVDDNGVQSLRIPLLSGSWQDSAKYTVRVIDVDNTTTHDYKVGAEAGQETSEADANYFTKIKVDGDIVIKSTDDNYASASGIEYLSVSSLNKGYYKILYVVEENSKYYYSTPASVYVENAEYKFDYTIQSGENAGLKVLVPETVAKSSDAANKIELPTAYVKNSSTDTVLDGVTASIKVFNDMGQVIDTSSEILKLEDGKYYFYPTTVGKYTIEYSYNYGQKMPEQITIEVKENFTAPTSDDLTIKTLSFDSLQLGEEVALKGVDNVTVNSKTSDNIQKNIKSIVVTNGTLTATLKNNQYKFTMEPTTFGLTEYTNDMLGRWEATYTIVDAYGNEKSKTFDLGTVKDAKAPQVYMAYDYEVDETTKLPVDTTKIDTTVLSEFKTELGYNELYFPAIYATSNVTNYDDFVFVRYIVKSNTTNIAANRYYIDNVMIVDGERHVITADETTYTTKLNKALITDDTINAGEANKATKFEFNVDDASTMAGKYYLGYEVYAKDITKGENTYKVNNSLFEFTILSTGTRETASSTDQKVEITNIADGESVESNGELEVKISASETKRTTSAGESTSYIDKYLENAVFYYYSTSSSSLQTDLESAFTAAKSARTTAFGKGHILTSDEFKAAMVSNYNGFAFATINDDKNYDITLENYDSYASGYVHIVALSLNDDGKIAYAQKTLSIKNVSDDVAPTFAGIENANSFNTTGDKSQSIQLTVKRGETVTLPDISFQDADKSLSMDVRYYRVTADEKTPAKFLSTNGMLLRNNSGDKSWIYGGTIVADTAGTYNVVYSATDDAGNTTFVYFTFEVVLETKPIFDVTVKGATPESSIINCETGTEIKFNPVIKDNSGNVLTENVVTYAYVEGSGYSSGSDDNSFVFNDQGTFVVKFYATYNGETVDTEGYQYTVNVTYPDLEWDTEIDTASYAYAPKSSVVTLPMLTASRGKEAATVTVTVKFKGDKQTVTLNEDFSAWQFTTGSTNGDYEVEYTASIDGSSKITKSFTIKVGDNVPPTIDIDYVDELGQDIVYDGETDIEFTINLKKTSNSYGDRKLEIVITNGDEKRTYNTNLVLQDRDETGTLKAIDWDNLSVVLKNGSSTMSTSSSSTNTSTYTINSTGTYTLVITAKDDNSNTQTKEISFNVKTETEVEKQKDTVVGVVLIVLSLVILAGVILFFTFTGKGKGGSKKAKSAKQPQVKQQNVVEAEKVEETVAEVEAPKAEAEQTENNDEAKSGDVE